MASDHVPNGLPLGLEAYKRTVLFTEETVPKGLLQDHSTKAGTWGLIHVLAGNLRYRITDPRRSGNEVMLAPDRPPGVVEPTIVHHVEPLGPVRFYVEFHRLIEATTNFLSRDEEHARDSDQREARPVALKHSSSPPLGATQAAPVQRSDESDVTGTGL